MEKNEYNIILLKTVNMLTKARDFNLEMVEQYEALLGFIKVLREELDNKEERINDLKQAVEGYDLQNEQLKKELRRFTKMN